MTREIQFINHASFIYEDDEVVVLCDPWVEGTAFNNGWALLDGTTTIEDLISRINVVNKKVFIWYSHEHSDHLSFPFLIRLQQVIPSATILFQDSLDRRVQTHLRRLGFETAALKNGRRRPLGGSCSIICQQWVSGDSFAIFEIRGADSFYILNLNDCVVSSQRDANRVRRYLSRYNIPRVDILCTQFGYASWVGNEDDVGKRIDEADAKLKDLGRQVRTLGPELTLLFASFFYFCNDSNFYLNDLQNTPSKVRSNPHLEDLQQSLIFLKPWGRIALERPLTGQLEQPTSEAELHWERLHKKSIPISWSGSSRNLDEIKASGALYFLQINKAFPLLFRALEIVKIVSPLLVFLTDHERVVELSYRSQVRLLDRGTQWDVSMHSNDLEYGLANLHGFNTVHVNGRFRASSGDALRRFVNFYGPQTLVKNGLGWRRPRATSLELLRLAKKRLRAGGSTKPA